MDGKETLGFFIRKLRNICIQTECFVLARLSPWRLKGNLVIAGVALINHSDLLSLGTSFKHAGALGNGYWI